MSGKFLDIYKYHFGEGGRNNIKLYLFLYIVMKLGMFLKGIFLVWTNGYWSFRCGSTWPVAASLGRFEGWGLPTVLLPWATEGKSQAGVGMAKGGRCLQFRQLNSSSSTASDCQQFISRTLPVNIFFLNFFMLMVTTQPSPSHPNSPQENREYFSKLLSCNECTQQMLCEFSQNKKRLSCLYDHSIL